MEKGRKGVLVAAGILWLLACLGGGAVLLRYASTAGEGGEAGAAWPLGSALVRSPDRHTLVVAVHPHCPCTRASVAELNSLVLALKGRIKAYVLVMKPSDFPGGWEDTDVAGSARRIPGATVLTDPDGVEAAKFGAKTSGQAVLYDERGRRLFSGGITSGRGHRGDNAGVQRITSLVKTGKADKNDSLVFGCPLGAKACSMGSVDKVEKD